MCAFWGIASGIVGAVVVLMGVIAMRPMLNAGYDVRLASGAITAGGTLGILIPPSVMLIVYAAVAGQSIVKLYAAAMLPGFFLTFLYLVYILGWAIINPKIAPKLPPDQYRLAVPDWLKRLERGRVTKRRSRRLIAAAFRPGLLRGATTAGWPAGRLRPDRQERARADGAGGADGRHVRRDLVVCRHLQRAGGGEPRPSVRPAAAVAPPTAASRSRNGRSAADTEKAAGARSRRRSEVQSTEPSASADAPPEEMSSARRVRRAIDGGQSSRALLSVVLGLGRVLRARCSLIYFWRMDGEQFEILKELVGVRGAARGAHRRGARGDPVRHLHRHRVGGGGRARRAVPGGDGEVSRGRSGGGVSSARSAASRSAGRTRISWSCSCRDPSAPRSWGPSCRVLMNLRTSPELRQNIKEATFLTAKTTAMVCWLFVGSALFSAVFALHGGQGLIERWVLSMNLSPLGFQFMAQMIIFLLGWPLEWTEIIVIFCPIFIPLLSHFQIDPILFGTMVAVNLQAAFLSPPVAMSAFYLKGVAPKHVTLNQIFAGMMPYMIIVCMCLAFMYIWPGMTLWLPEFLYGN